MGVICVLIGVLLLLLFLQVIVSWLLTAGWRPRGPLYQVVDVLYRIANPIFRPLRGLLPPIRMGAMGLDLSPLIVFIVLGILQRIICSLS
jgi:YggT family protein